MKNKILQIFALLPSRNLTGPDDEFERKDLEGHVIYLRKDKVSNIRPGFLADIEITYIAMDNGETFAAQMNIEKLAKMIWGYVYEGQES